MLNKQEEIPTGTSSKKSIKELSRQFNPLNTDLGIPVLNKTSLLILIPLVVLVDVGAITSLSQDLHPDSNAEIFFLMGSAIFFIFAGFMLFKKRPLPKVMEDPLKKVGEAIVDPKDQGRF